MGYFIWKHFEIYLFLVVLMCRSTKFLAFPLLGHWGELASWHKRVEEETASVFTLSLVVIMRGVINKCGCLFYSKLNKKACASCMFPFKAPWWMVLQHQGGHRSYLEECLLQVSYTGCNHLAVQSVNHVTGYPTVNLIDHAPLPNVAVQ